jgi:hypothetical protein
MRNSKKGTLENLEIHKDTREQNIEIGLVEILSTQAACHW